MCRSLQPVQTCGANQRAVSGSVSTSACSIRVPAVWLMFSDSLTAGHVSAHPWVMSTTMYQTSDADTNTAQRHAPGHRCLAGLACDSEGNPVLVAQCP